MLIYFLIYFIIGILISICFFHYCYYESKTFNHTINEEIILCIMLYLLWPIFLTLGLKIAIKGIKEDKKK